MAGSERRIVVAATRNAHKCRELAALAGEAGFAVVGLGEFPGAPEVEETGTTFEENARLKAEAMVRVLGRPVLADDSGLCVDALDGEPGVRSARYAAVDGGQASDAENNARLLEEMRGRRDRGCAFVCALAWAVPGRATRIFRGETRGTLLAAPRGGAGGFGYDPLFLSDDLGVTFAEASAEQKNAVSHRGRALAAWRAALDQPVDRKWHVLAEGERLRFPVRRDAEKTWIRVERGGRRLFEASLRLARGRPADEWVDYWVGGQQGAVLTVVDEGGADGPTGLFSGIRVAGTVDRAERRAAYADPRRPLFHYTSRTGWLNDPNGLVFHQGRWHLFYQHNPFGTDWGNMSWGHAVSDDLAHWEEEPEALLPDERGVMFSGCAVVDDGNTSGVGVAGGGPPLVLAYTCEGGGLRDKAPTTVDLAYSTDGGRTFAKGPANPVLPQIEPGNRDPKIIWHTPTRQWIMALYLKGRDFALFASPDLRQWKRIQDISGFGGEECPDFFPLPLEGRDGDERWVFWCAKGAYQVGRFDGRAFAPQTPVKAAAGEGSHDYAAQTFDRAPDGRRIQISWMRGAPDFGDAPFNQQLTVPRALTLHDGPDGPFLAMNPVRELAALRRRPRSWRALRVEPDVPLFVGWEEEAGDVELTVSMREASRFSVTLAGQRIRYEGRENKLYLNEASAPMKPENNTLNFRLLLDRASVEVFGARGAAVLTQGMKAGDPACRMRGFAFQADGMAEITQLDAWAMASIWGV